MKTARWLVWLGAFVLLVAALLHAYGGVFVSPALARSNLSPELIAAMKSLWWSFSLYNALLSLVVFWANRQPDRPLILLGGFGLAAETVLTYAFLGVFIASIMLGCSALLILAGGFMLRSG